MSLIKTAFPQDRLLKRYNSVVLLLSLLHFYIYLFIYYPSAIPGGDHTESRLGQSGLYYSHCREHLPTPFGESLWHYNPSRASQVCLWVSVQRDVFNTALTGLECSCMCAKTCLSRVLLIQRSRRHYFKALPNDQDPHPVTDGNPSNPAEKSISAACSSDLTLLVTIHSLWT